MAKSNSLPKWVIDGIKNVKFSKPKTRKSSGYVLEMYADDRKADIQLYDAIEDGRRHCHDGILEKNQTFDLNVIERGTVYEFSFEESKGKIDPKIVEYLKETKEVEMDSVYQFAMIEMTKVDKD